MQDTEFPGVVARPVGSFTSHTDYHYQTLRCNVDLLKIIQLGITFADENGELADGCPTWQFNFRFNLQCVLTSSHLPSPLLSSPLLLAPRHRITSLACCREDMYAQDSIELLVRSGIDFRLHEMRGIDVNVFGELLMSSGLVLNKDVKWISFHSGYDFGYLLKLLTNAQLPGMWHRRCRQGVLMHWFISFPLAADEPAFFDLLHTYFPCLYDVKYLMNAFETLKGGLNKLAEDLEVERVGPMHQAGSDSLLTSSTFFKLRKMFFDGKIDDTKYCGFLFGLGA
jgi:CCR4-NOT transcription complex subunit 7/8